MNAIDVRQPALPDLFDPTLPNAPMLFAVLEGRLPGRALADAPVHPRVSAVQTAEGIAFISRTQGQAEFNGVLDALRRDATVGLVWPAGRDGPVTPPVPAKVLDRLGFDPIPATGERLEHLRQAMPAGMVVRAMDAGLLARCAWRELVEGAHGSIDAFLANGIGVCLMREDEIVAEAYAPFIGGGVAEIGVVTAETHRGQGLAAIAIASLAADLAARGLEMYWSCDTTNEPSIRVADKLGFGPARPFGILLYRPMAE